MTRYWQAYFIYRVRLWLYFARIVNANIMKANHGDTEAQWTIDLIGFLTDYDYVGDGFHDLDSLDSDIRDVQRLFTYAIPFYKFASWRWQVQSELVPVIVELVA